MLACALLRPPRPQQRLHSKRQPLTSLVAQPCSRSGKHHGCLRRCPGRAKRERARALAAARAQRLSPTRCAPATRARWLLNASSRCDPRSLPADQRSRGTLPHARVRGRCCVCCERVRVRVRRRRRHGANVATLICALLLCAAGLVELSLAKRREDAQDILSFASRAGCGVSFSLLRPSPAPIGAAEPKHVHLFSRLAPVPSALCARLPVLRGGAGGHG